MDPEWQFTIMQPRLTSMGCTRLANSSKTGIGDRIDLIRWAALQGRPRDERLVVRVVRGAEDGAAFVVPRPRPTATKRAARSPLVPVSCET